MDLPATRYAGVAVLSPGGRVDHRTADALEAALAPHLAECSDAGTPIVLDLAGVDYMSSVGLRVLMVASKQCRRQRGRIVVAALQPTLAEIFEISRFGYVFDVHDTVRDALAALSPEAAVAYDAA